MTVNVDERHSVIVDGKTSGNKRNKRANQDILKSKFGVNNSSHVGNTSLDARLNKTSAGRPGASLTKQIFINDTRQ